MRAGLIAVVLAGCAHAAPVPASESLPVTARLVDPGGAEFAPATRWHGEVVVLDFWASWCKACKQSVPRVSRLAAAFARDGLVVVGVNVGDREDKARAAATELAIGYPIALDPEFALADVLGASQLPMVLVLDRDGAIVHRSREVDAGTLAVVRRLLAPRTAAAVR